VRRAPYASPSDYGCSSRAPDGASTTLRAAESARSARSRKIAQPPAERPRGAQREDDEQRNHVAKPLLNSNTNTRARTTKKTTCGVSRPATISTQARHVPGRGLTLRRGAA